MSSRKEFNKLCEAIDRCNADEVGKLLDTDIDVNQQGDTFLYRKTITFIYKAVSKASYISYKKLAEVNAIMQILELLLKYGANPNTKQDDDRHQKGFLLLNSAIYPYPNKSIMNMLLKYGADPNLKNDLGDSALHFITIAIQEAKRSMQAVSPIEGMRFISPYSETDIRAWVNCLKLLLLWGADPTIKNHSGQSVIEVFPMIETMQSTLIHKASRYHLITSQGKADWAALRAFLNFTKDERFIWGAFMGFLRHTKSFPPEVTAIIGSFLFTSALSKYSLPFEAWISLYPNPSTPINDSVTPKATK